VQIGYTLMGEQRSPKDLVRNAQLAEQAGFDFLVASDHYFPWLEVQGHSPYTWAVLGAVAQATERIPFMTYVTCPIVRYHPAVVAQKAATLALLSDGRFSLGLGAGENLNELVVAVAVEVSHPSDVLPDEVPTLGADDADRLRRQVELALHGPVDEVDRAGVRRAVAEGADEQVVHAVSVEVACGRDVEPTNECGSAW
jgi:alkanesulfonate monooxygenase SsuD/methylene tetrahydromethanopterin reductase-like flavin-dependent oxidoreductase (luciferase family)